MRPSSVLVAVSFAMACREKPPAILTEVSIELPPDDAASTEWEVFRVRVWPAGEACLSFVAWAGADCDGQNPAPPELWDDLAVEVTRGSAPEIALDRSEGWDVAVEGLRLETHEPFLFGCAHVSSGEPAVVRLRRRVGDEDVCAGVYHRCCPVYVRCDIPDGGSPEEPGSPTCLSAATEATCFEQDGVDCTPDGGLLQFPCTPARVSCERGATTALEEGVCPKGEEEPACSTSMADDLNCDGVTSSLCGLDGGCRSGATEDCGRVDRDGGSCFAGAMTCTEAGTWGPCERRIEDCNGLDDDCDGLSDEVDDDAARFCARTENLLADHCGPSADGGIECRCVDDSECGPPLSDVCSPDGCHCGDGPPCGEGDPPVTDSCGRGGCTCGGQPPCGGDGLSDRCSEGNCLCGGDQECGPPLSDHCGSGRCLCGDGPKCGQEQPLPLTSACGPEGCRCGDEAECGPPLSDRCVRQRCACGDREPCERGQQCCEGSCIDGDADCA